MKIERLNPQDVASRSFYHHVVRSESRFLVHISGQVGIDANGAAVGVDDYSAHVEQAYRNLDMALAAVGATRSDVVKVTTYAVGCDHDTRWPVIKSIHESFFSAATPAWTVVGVEALARPDLLIEVEAVAAAD